MVTLNINFNANINISSPQLTQIQETLDQLTVKVDKLMATDAEMVVILQDVAAQQQKTIDEIVVLQETVTTLNEQVAALEDQIANMGNDASPELVAQVAEVKRLAQLADDQIPDVPPPGPVVNPQG